MKKLLALLTAAVATLTSAWAATVTFADGSTTNFTVKNSEGNAGNYNWNGCTTFTIKIPAKDNLAEGTKVELKSLTFIKGNGSIVANVTDTPSSVTIDGCTATVTNNTTDPAFGTGRTASVYTFPAGARPLMTVGTAVSATMGGITNLRACPTSNNGDTDVVIGIQDNTAYQPLALLDCAKVATATIAEGNTDFGSIVWDNDYAPSADIAAHISVSGESSITMTEATTIAGLRVTGEGQLTVNNPQNLTVSGISGANTTLLYVDQLPDSAALRNAGWNGTVWIKRVTLKDTGLTNFNMNNYGNAASKVKLTGIKGWLATGVYVVDVILADEGSTPALTITDGSSNSLITFNKLSGTGTLTTTSNGGSSQKFLVKDNTDFAGALVMQANKGITFGDNTTNGAGNNQICIKDGRNVTMSKAWTASAGIKGDGVITFAAYPTYAVNLSNDFAGTVILPETDRGNTGTGIAITSWVKANSTLKICGLTGNNIYIGNGGTASIPGTVELVDGATFTLNNGNSGAKYTFNKICGEGTLNIPMKAGVTCSFEITTLSGNVAINCTRPLTLSNVVTSLESQPTEKVKVVSLGSNTNDVNIESAVFTLADGSTHVLGTAAVEGDGDAHGVYITPVEADVTIGDRKYVTIADATADLRDGETIADIVILSDTVEVPADYKLVEKGDSWGLAPRDATTVYATSKAMTTFVLGSNEATHLVDGDTIYIDNHMQGDVWGGGANLSSLAAYQVVVSRHVDLGANVGIPDNGKVTIDFRNTEGTQGIYLYGNIGESAVIDGTGILFLGHTSNACSIGNGTVISCDVGFQSPAKTVTINGEVAISGTIAIDNGAFKLADGATLTCAKLAAGKVTTDVEGKIVAYVDGAYTLIAKPTVTVTETTIEGLTSAYIYTAGELVEYFGDWEANFEVTFGADIAAGDVELKGSFGEYDMQTFPMPTEGVSANTPWTLLPSSGAGSVTYAEVVGIGTFTCGVNNIKAAVGTTMKVDLVIKNGEKKIVLNTQNYALEEAPAPTYPEEIESSDEDVKSAFDAWVQEHNVTDPSSANVNAFVLGLAPEATTEAIQQAVEDEVPAIDMAELVDGDLKAAVAAIQDKYPNATVTLKDVTTDVAGEGATNTHLYKLVIELKK